MSFKNIIVNIIEKFFVCITVCIVLTVIVSGKIAVEQSGREMINGTKYVSVALENNEKTIELHKGEKVYTVDKSVFEKLLKIKK